MAPLFPTVSHADNPELKPRDSRWLCRMLGRILGPQTHVLCDKRVYSQPASPASAADWAPVAAQANACQRGRERMGREGLPCSSLAPKVLRLTSATTWCSKPLPPIAVAGGPLRGRRRRTEPAQTGLPRLTRAGGAGGKARASRLKQSKDSPCQHHSPTPARIRLWRVS